MSKAHEELEKKVDDEVASLNASIASAESKLTAHENLNASTTQKGHVQLSSATSSDSETLAATPKAVKDAAAAALSDAKEYVDEKFGTVAEAMNFKGSASPSELTTIISTANNGDTYKVTSNGTIGDEKVEIGDMVIAHVEGSSRNWIVVQANIDGAVTAESTLSKNRLIVGDGNRDIKIFDAGSSGQVLKSTGSGIQWEDEVKNRAINADGSEVLAEGSTSALNIVSGENIDIEVASGKITINAEDTTYTAGEGVTISGVSNEVKINKATAYTLGGIKVGYTESGNNHAVKVDSTGNAYVEVDATITAGEGIVVDGRQVKLATHGTANTYGTNTGSNVT
jgi:hypothetical protein